MISVHIILAIQRCHHLLVELLQIGNSMKNVAKIHKTEIKKQFIKRRRQMFRYENMATEVIKVDLHNGVNLLHMFILCFIYDLLPFLISPNESTL